MQSGPSVIAFASPAFADAFAVSTAAPLARVHACAFHHETSITLAHSWCQALAVIAFLAIWHASASVSRFIFKDIRGSRVLCFKSEVREDESVVAFADLGRDARAVAAGRADGLASASFRVSIAVETHAVIRRRARAIAAFDVANRLATERNVFPVVINHAITVLADAEIRPLADPVCLAGWVTDRIARVRLIRRTVARIAAAHVGLRADTVPATRIANRLAEARTIALGRLVAGVASAFVWRGAVSIDAISLADGLAYVPRIRRTIALVALASFWCAAEAVDAILAT